MQTGLTIGQAAKCAKLGDKIRRAAWQSSRPSIIDLGYPGGSLYRVFNAEDLGAEDWIAEGTEYSV